MMDAFWAGIDAQLDRIEAERPATFEGVRDALGGSGDAAFFGGSGGDRSLASALEIAGWSRAWSEASYFYAARHPATGAVLTYIEGDVLRGNHRPLPEAVGAAL